MGAVVLGPVRRQAPERLIKIDFAAEHTSDLVAPLGCQHEQANDGAKVVIQTGPPDNRQFIIAENAVS
jgi:hypothetical protein